MSDDDTLLASLAPRLAGAVEDAATDALAYVLNKSAKCREALARIVSDDGFELVSLVHATTQSAPRGSGRLDLAAYDGAGSLRLIIVSKFRAPLLSGQASGYVDYLDDQQPSVLLFVAPEVRHTSLWSKINQQFDEADNKHLTRVHDNALIKAAEVSDSRKRIAMTTWGTLLDLLGDADTATGDDIRQLKGLARAQDDQAFLPLSADDLSASIPRRMLDFNRIVNDVVDAHGVHLGWMTTEGLRAAAHCEGYLRHFKFLSQGGNRTSSDLALAVSCEQWAESASTPLWLRIRHDCPTEIAAVRTRSEIEHSWSPGNPMWIPLRLLTDSEYPDVLEHVVAQVEDVRDIVLSALGEAEATNQVAADADSTVTAGERTSLGGNDM